MNKQPIDPNRLYGLYEIAHNGFIPGVNTEIKNKKGDISKSGYITLYNYCFWRGQGKDDRGRRPVVEKTTAKKIKPEHNSRPDTTQRTNIGIRGKEIIKFLKLNGIEVKLKDKTVVSEKKSALKKITI